jgi:hypothetical protein
VSRLDSFIRRLQAQRTCLGAAALLISEVPGPVLEIGLGNGRTYDHLRELLPERPIFAFDRRIDAHPDCRPEPGFVILGDVRQTLPRTLARIGRPAALVHMDIGSGDEAASRGLAAALAPHLAGLLAPGGVLAGDQPVDHEALEAIPLPDGVESGRYHLYRRS